MLTLMPSMPLIPGRPVRRRPVHHPGDQAGGRGRHLHRSINPVGHRLRLHRGRGAVSGHLDRLCADGAHDPGVAGALRHR